MFLIIGCSLLDELDDDLMLELDQVVRQNQLACLPYSKSQEAEEELFSTYPELSALIEKNRRAKFDLMALHPRPHDDDTHLDGSSRPGDVIGNKSGSIFPISKSHQSLIKDQKNRVKDPLLQIQSSAGNLMFEMDEGLEPMDELDGAKSALVGRLEHSSGIEQQRPAMNVSGSNDWPIPGDSASSGRKPAPAISESPLLVSGQDRSSDVDGEPNQRHLSSSSDKTPWNYPTTSSKSDMKLIMAQASSNRPSNISSGVSSQTQTAAASSGSPARLSQRERKKRQQQQLSEIQPSTPSSSPVVAPTPPLETTPISPWQMSSPATKVSLEEVLRADSKSVSPSSNRRKSSRASSNPPLTLRQTVSGNTPSAQRAFSAGDGLEDSRPNSSPNSLPLNTSRHSSIINHHPSRSISAVPSLPPAPSTAIQSIRHQPPVVEPSLQLSMADILALQQTEKDIIKEAAAKRSLQDIQEEQAFQEWWDQESRKVMEKEEKAGEQRTDAGGREGSGGRGKARDPGREGNSKGGGRGGSRDGRGGRGGLSDGRGGASNGGGSGSRSRGRRSVGAR